MSLTLESNSSGKAGVIKKKKKLIQLIKFN